MLQTIRGVLLLLAAAFSSSAFAQTSVTPAPAPNQPITRTYTQRTELAEAYRFAAGDVVSIQVMNFPEFSAHPPVQPDGAITMPLVGAVKVSGKTVAEVQQELTEKLSEYIKQPVVIVTVEGFHTPTVWVLGQVKGPGPVRFQSGFSINDYISAAGGPSETADIGRVTVNRTDKTSVTVDVSPRADPSIETLEIRENDLIVVPEQKGNLSVLGRVAKPGSYAFHRGMTISDAITLAGGTLDDADPSQVQIMGQSKTLVADYQSFIEGAKPDQNVELQAGDVVFVPESKQKVQIYGSVTRPGVYKFREGETIMALVLRAGGLAGEAAPGATALVRSSKDQPKPIKIDLTQYMKSGNTESNPILTPFDIVYVPEKGKEKQTWTTISQGALTLLSVFDLFGWR